MGSSSIVVYRVYNTGLYYQIVRGVPIPTSVTFLHHPHARLARVRHLRHVHRREPQARIRSHLTSVHHFRLLHLLHSPTSRTRLRNTSVPRPSGLSPQRTVRRFVLRHLRRHRSVHQVCHANLFRPNQSLIRPRVTTNLYLNVVLNKVVLLRRILTHRCQVHGFFARGHAFFLRLGVYFSVAFRECSAPSTPVAGGRSQ